MEKKKRNSPRWYICHRPIQENGLPHPHYKILRGPYFDHKEARCTLLEKIIYSAEDNNKYPLAIFTRTGLDYYGHYPNSRDGNRRLLEDTTIAAQKVERLGY